VGEAKRKSCSQSTKSQVYVIFCHWFSRYSHNDMHILKSAICGMQEEQTDVMSFFRYRVTCSYEKFEQLKDLNCKQILCLFFCKNTWNVKIHRCYKLLGLFPNGNRFRSSWSLKMWFRFRRPHHERTSKPFQYKFSHNWAKLSESYKIERCLEHETQSVKQQTSIITDSLGISIALNPFMFNISCSKGAAETYLNYAFHQVLLGNGISAIDYLLKNSIQDNLPRKHINLLILSQKRCFTYRKTFPDKIS